MAFGYVGSASTAKHVTILLNEVVRVSGIGLKTPKSAFAVVAALVLLTTTAFQSARYATFSFEKMTGTIKPVLSAVPQFIFSATKV